MQWSFDIAAIIIVKNKKEIEIKNNNQPLTTIAQFFFLRTVLFAPQKFQIYFENWYCLCPQKWNLE